MLKSLIRKFKYKWKYKNISISRFANVTVESIDSNGPAGIGNFVTVAGAKLNLKGHNFILDSCVIDATNITFGKNTSLQVGSFLHGEIHIGNDVIIGPHFYASSSIHDFKTNPSIPIRVQDEINRVRGVSKSKSIKIEDDCWIGMNSFIAPGVKLSKGNIVGFGSVVNKIFPPYSIIAGSPAKIVGTRLTYSPPNHISRKKSTDYPYFYSGFSVENDTVVTIDNKISIHLDFLSGKQLTLKFVDNSENIKVMIADKSYELIAPRTQLEINLSELQTIDKKQPLSMEVTSSISLIELDEAWVN